MEVATTNNHNQTHHHHHHHHHVHHNAGNSNNNSVAGGSRSPFQREVREWQRIDPDTGALFSGRLEADRWINGPLNSYGKISDSQNISQPNGTQQTKRKQLEVLRTANGQMQVIRTQTVQKTSSTSRWSSSSTSTTATATATPIAGCWAKLQSQSKPQSLDICELSNDDDDVSDSDSDAGVAIVNDDYVESLPASRQLVDDHVDFVVINGQTDDQDQADDVAHLHKVRHNLLPDTAPSLKLSNLMKSSSSISSQSSNSSNLATATATATAAAGNTHSRAGKISLHAIVGQTAAAATSSAATTTTWSKQADIYGKNNNNNNNSNNKQRSVGGATAETAAAAAAADVAATATPTQRRDLESFRHDNNDNDDDDDDDLRLSARHQRRQQVSQSVYAPPLPASFSSSLQRARSISTDDLSNEFLQQQQQPEQDAEPGEWQRVSQLRRSFQSQDYHKASNRARPRPLELPNSSVSVARMRAELENGRRLNTAMRNNQVDLVAIDNILNATAAKPPVAKRSTFLTAESLQEIRGKLKKLSDESLYKDDFLALQTPPSPSPPPAAAATVAATPSAFRAVHNTHSLETRQARVKESASDWHLRRKSYGFEKMSPPENRSIFRVDASTDSGLGRSGEQLGSWSPSAASNATVIHFGRQQSSEQSAPVDSELSKRHSIAVEETWRDIRKTSQVQVNGSAAATPSQLQRSSAQKRVEFCKTEVHFAAESGRVNIVETDGKPPPTQNFRRRRRTASGPLQSLVKSASVSSSSSSNSSSSSFGTEPNRRQTIATSTVAYRATLMEPPELVTQPAAATQVTVVTATPQPALEPRFSLLESTSRHSYTSTSGVDTTDNETDELAHIRGILKNKPVKPKPYHLGENIESADALWSVPATMKSEREQSPHSRESATGDSPISIKSVAERVRIVEQRQQQQPAAAQQASPAGNGYSTKINVSLGNEEWTETDLPKSNVMNIALHAPKLQKPKPTPPTLRIGQLVPIAKPRTLLVQPLQTQLSTDTADDSGSESLKIVKEARGARKLREHELSYFGVQNGAPSSPQPTRLKATPTNPRRTLPTRSKLSHNEVETAATTTTTTKWQLLNDRPDLLRHSPQSKDDKIDAAAAAETEHCYENIANELTTTFRVKSPSPMSYERKTDLQRDAQILSEMTRNADQTMKALSDEAAFKDQRRRSFSLQRRSNKPLATIDEKVKAYNGDGKPLAVARGTFASEARRNSRQSTPSPTRARSSSQSSIECCPRDRSRSSSRESMPQGGGSSDEQHSKQRVERLRLRTPKREKSRHESTEQRSAVRQSSKARSSSAHVTSTSSSQQQQQHHSRSHSHRDKEPTASSSSSRLVRSARIPSEESRTRSSAHRNSERERERERSRGSEKHRDELTRSRGHSSRSRHSEQQQQQQPQSHRSSKSSRHHHDTTTAAATTTTAAHRKSTTTATTTAAKSALKATTTHKVTTAAPTTATTTTTPHNELTHGKSTLNGHHHHHQHQHHSSGSGKHHVGAQPQHHVHSLTTTTIAATKHQRERHGKDRK